MRDGVFLSTYLDIDFGSCEYFKPFCDVFWTIGRGITVNLGMLNFHFKVTWMFVRNFNTPFLLTFKI